MAEVARQISLFLNPAGQDDATDKRNLIKGFVNSSLLCLCVWPPYSTRRNP